MSDNSSFLLKRLMSITGLIPVGGFLLQHLFGNSFIFVSAETWNEHAEYLTSLPMVLLIELVAIYIPITLHAALGVAIVYRGQNNFTSYSLFRNWMFFFQRLTGVIALIFIATHSYTTRITSYLQGWEMTASHVTRVLQDPIWFWFYVVGVVSACFHFSNGIWSFLITWGITVGKKAQQVSSALSMGLFVALALWAVAILIKFASLPLS
ncbi:MAG: succinate dehydrogenase [Deltaproteobacteria bacterium]|nr:MAG: succinate dehydrogenase [Deltaproteobacteria bacterium]